MSNAHVSPSTLDFVDVDPAAAPESGGGPSPSPERTQTAAPLHSGSGIGYAIEKVLYAGLIAGFITLLYGLSTLLHF